MRAPTYNDDNRMTSITYGGVTDLYYYQYTGLRYRARLAGTYYRYLYDGERVLEELNDSGTMTARYTTENGSYYGSLLHLYRPTGTLSRFPMYDNIGTARGLVDASGTVTDTYELDTFGRSVSSTGSTPNPYRFGGAWGYITDPSGMQQLGQRFYWPELGRFVSQDPIGDGGNWYAYVEDNPVRRVDPTGKVWWNPLSWSCKTKCYVGAGLVIGATLGVGITTAATVVTVAATAALTAAELLALNMCLEGCKPDICPVPPPPPPLPPGPNCPGCPVPMPAPSPQPEPVYV